MPSKRASIATATLCALLSAPAAALDNGLGRTPPMGYNTWNRFACNINETLIRQTADAMVASGLLAAGYNYLNIDDCWAASRNASGYIVEDPVTFPSGMKALAAYVHSKGLKFGIYTDEGTKTCAGRPGSLGYEKQDADWYASVGVDYVKVDNCYSPEKPSAAERYAVMRDALNATAHPIFYSICNWGVEKPWEWGMATGNSWRTTMDISDKYGSFIFNLLSTVPLAKYAGPGGWNDPDMLEVGNGGMSHAAYRSHFALWVVMKSPLLVGCDVRHMDQATRDILLSKEAIAISQDPLGVAGDWTAVTSEDNSTRVMVSLLSNGDRVAVLFNMEQQGQGRTRDVTVDFARDMGLPAGTVAAVRDVYSTQQIGSFNNQFTTSVPPEDCVFIRVSVVAKQQGVDYMAWRPWQWRE